MVTDPINPFALTPAPSAAQELGGVVIKLET